MAQTPLNPSNTDGPETAGSKGIQSPDFSLIDDITTSIEFESIQGLIDTFYGRVGDIGKLIPVLESESTYLADLVSVILYPDGINDLDSKVGLNVDDYEVDIETIDIERLVALVPQLNLLIQTYNRLSESVGPDGPNNHYDLEKDIKRLGRRAKSEELDQIEALRAKLEDHFDRISDPFYVRNDLDRIYYAISGVKGIDTRIQFIDSSKYETHKYLEPTFIVV